MIKSITIRDVASYDHKGVTFDDLAKVNIVYGGNGTGKTTLSRYLRNIEERIVFPSAEQYRYTHCNIELDSDLKDWSILVYNKDFREENLKEDMPGIFTLGEDYVNYENKLLHELIPMVEAYKKNELSEEGQQQLLQLHHELEGKFNIVNRYRPSIDYINSMLQKMGYTNFSIQMSPTKEECYQIQRNDGSFVFNSLSEGETTFITFLYFMQVVNKPVSDMYENRHTLVVIDDPISSLDAQAMEVAGTQVRELMKKAHEGVGGIDQVIVLTHNLEFMKQVSPRQRRRDTHYWRLAKKDDVSRAIALGEEKPVRSGYELMWEELREESERLDSTCLPNLMRSIIETYFVLYGGYNKNKLFSGGYMSTPADQIATDAFFKGLDERSHFTAEDLYAADPLQVNDRFMEAFRQFFIQMGHEAHYKMMMRLG